MASKSPSSPADKNVTQNASIKGTAKETDANSKPLPFEPTSSRKKQPKQSAKTPSQSSSKQSDQSTQKPTLSQRAFTGVPEVVSQRMARRMAFFCGIPTALGMLTFIVSYLIVTRHLFDLPTIAVLLVSLGFFGLGVLGLSYGAFSASWDVDRTGTWFGFSEFKINVGRAIASWKESRQPSSQ